MFQVPDPRQLLPLDSMVFSGEHYRFTVLTSQLIRLEWSPNGAFLDGPTQIVTNRNFAPVPVEVEDSEELLQIRTEHLNLQYNKQVFSPSGLSISFRQKGPATHRTTWYFGDDLSTTTDASGNLGGTARTLDGVDGACPLEPGILSRYGFAVVDDSTSVEVGVEDWVAPRAQGGQDLYFFGHGLDFHGALTDYFHLTGAVPLVPRAALGNWWSRYWQYSEEEYLQLMSTFKNAQIPFSVAVIDMDWHLVDIDPSLGTGWTGYTWNRELFPDPQRFLNQLHDQGKLVTLNLHPADGVRAHEDAYPAMAADLGIDPSTEKAIAFDITDPEFVSSYLKRLHHPLEEQGVDFWWLDWQQGGVTRMPGLDPLWMLNHIHYHDSGRDGGRPLTFSRYSGLGSHRYPVGFSGDTVTTWASLDFQPRFTATAANVGYTWWSHDNGGHYGGIKDDELTTRWVQFGAFSPINRLHSSMDPFNSKDPTLFPSQVRQIMTAFLQLRHLLVPFLYTAAWRAHSDAVAVVRPMYHDYADQDAAYTVPNQYLLGDGVIVAPITTPVDRASLLASVSVWLPEGQWFDLLTGQSYSGGRHLVMRRPLSQIPVLARAGSTITMLEDPMEDIGTNPETLVLRVIPGSGQSTLIEDDGGAQPTGPARVETTITTVSEDSHISIDLSADGAATLSGAGVSGRFIVLDLAGVVSVDSVEISGKSVAFEAEMYSEHLAPALRVRLGRHRLEDGVSIRFSGVQSAPESSQQRAFELLDRAQMEYDLKHRAFEAVNRSHGILLAQYLDTIPLPDSLRGALLEISGD